MLRPKCSLVEILFSPMNFRPVWLWTAHPLPAGRYSGFVPCLIRFHGSPTYKMRRTERTPGFPKQYGLWMGFNHTIVGITSRFFTPLRKTESLLSWLTNFDVWMNYKPRPSWDAYGKYGLTPSKSIPSSMDAGFFYYYHCWIWLFLRIFDQQQRDR